MPPCKKKQRKAAATPQAASLESLPPGVLQIIAAQLVTQDKLNNILTSMRDIASVAITSRTLNQLANGTLWQMLGKKYTGEGGSRSAISCVPKMERYEEVYLSSKVRKVKAVPAAKAIAKAYEEDVPDVVPQHIYSEYVRLRCLGTAGSNAKKEFNLTDADLKNVPHEEKSRGALGTVHVYRLADLLQAARAKHGSVQGMAAQGVARAARAEERKRGVQEAAEKRRKALEDGLKPLGAKLCKTMEQVGPVARYLKGGKDAPRLDAMLPFLQLVDWCVRNTTYSGIRTAVVQSESRWLMYKVSFREEMEDSGHYGGNYFAAADEAAASLSQEEEEDCIRLACQVWGERHGGVEAAGGRQEMPREGRLREAILASMQEKVLSSVRDDGGLMYWCDMEGDLEAAEAEEGRAAAAAAPAVAAGEAPGDDGDAAEAEGAKAAVEGGGHGLGGKKGLGLEGDVGEVPEEREGVEEGGMEGRQEGKGKAPAGQRAEDPHHFFRGAEHLIQVEARAGSEEELAAWEGRVRSKLHLLARMASCPSNPDKQVGDARVLCLPFRPPQGAAPAAAAAATAAAATGSSGGGGAGEHRSMFFVRFSKMQEPTSLLNGKPYSWARASRGSSKLDLSEAMQNFEGAANKWERRKPGMEVGTALIEAWELPEWVKEAAGVAEAPQQQQQQEEQGEQQPE